MTPTKGHHVPKVLATVVALAAAGLLAASLLRPTDLPPLTMGYQICNSPAENHRRFDPLTAYLARELGREVRAVHLDTGDFLDPEHQGYDLYHVNSLIYVNLHAAGAAEVTAAELQGEGGANTQGWIVARKDSGIRRVEDLRGKRLIFGPMLSPGGYLAQYHALREAGLDPEKDLALYTFPWGAWKHEKVIYAVYYGAADAGAARYDDLELMARDYKIDPEEFVVIHKSPWVPWCTLAASPRLDPKVAARFRKALLALRSGDTVKIGAERFDVLRWAEVTGFAPASESDYDGVREMARAVGMPPYESW